MFRISARILVPRALPKPAFTFSQCHRRYASSSGPFAAGMDPKMALAAQKIFDAIQRDPALLQLCSTLSMTLAKKKLIDPANPTRKPSMSELMKIAMDGEVSGLIKQVGIRLKALGVLDDEAVRNAAGGSGGGIMSALFGGSAGAAPPPPAPLPSKTGKTIEDAEFVDVVDDGKAPKATVVDKVKNLFRK